MLQVDFRHFGHRRQTVAYLGGGVPVERSTLIQGRDYQVAAFTEHTVASAYQSILLAEVQAQVQAHEVGARPVRPLYQEVQTDHRVFRREAGALPTVVVAGIPDLARGMANAAYTVLGQLRDYVGLFWYLCGGEPERLILPGHPCRYTAASHPVDPHHHFHETRCPLRHLRYSHGEDAGRFYRARLAEFRDRRVS